MACGYMKVTSARSAGLPVATTAALMLGVFTVSVGFGIVLPLLPYLIERLLGAESDAALVSQHTGLLTAVYTLSLFLFAPMWGRLSDQRGPRGVLLVGLLGFGVTMLVFSFVESHRCLRRALHKRHVCCSGDACCSGCIRQRRDDRAGTGPSACVRQHDRD
ncbi:MULTISPECIES: MFS transporter [Gammaproteobacteria]|nr:MFS transporter [Leclercia adecarboxylata]MBH0128401.1 MFS transporter [Enterobacter sp. SECR18-0236]